jgi:hypothetical protein
MRPIQWTTVVLVSLGMAALADDQSDRQKLIGSWHQEAAAQNSSASSWTFSSAPNSIRITQLDGTNKVAEFACGTEGASCEIKTAGKKATVSLWFNGPRLVELETKGSEVIKRRFMILPNSDVMEMEVIPILPGGTPERLQFNRVELSARQK